MLPLWTGLVAGAFHVLSGPDHLAALAPLALERRSSAARLGALWGLGHGIGVVLLGVLAVVARGAVRPEAVSGVAELIVGAVLVLVGARALLRARGLVVHSHAHEHSDPHEHPHVHFGDEHQHAGHSHAVFGVGLLHGAAGAGHLFGVLPALALDSADALVYLGAYLVAAIGAMAGFGAALGWLGRWRPVALRHALQGSGALAVLVGLLWIGASWQALLTG